MRLRARSVRMICRTLKNNWFELPRRANGRSGSANTLLVRLLSLEPITELSSERFASVLFPPGLVTAAREAQVLELGDVLEK